jgi:hypothetical protein
VNNTAIERQVEENRRMFEQALGNTHDVLRKEAGCTSELDYRFLISKNIYINRRSRQGDNDL